MSATTAPAITDWTIDATHSTFEFAVRHMRVSTIKGVFSGVSGEIHFDPNDVASASVQVEIDMTTVDTHSEGRDERLRGESFFDVERYPTATFVSTRVEPAQGDRFTVIGDLTLRGVTREVAFETVFEGVQLTPSDSYRGAFTARATIKRTAFGFDAGRELAGGGYSVSDDVELAMFTSVNPRENG